jgi:hypothetical protein
MGLGPRARGLQIEGTRHGDEHLPHLSNVAPANRPLQLVPQHGGGQPGITAVAASGAITITGLALASPMLRLRAQR